MTPQSLQEEKPLGGSPTLEFLPCISPFPTEKAAREAEPSLQLGGGDDRSSAAE